jgi:riboflavin biosynthesis pyrimidine reductase
MYQVMGVWETPQTHAQPLFIAQFANMWRAADKVVYSKTLVRPSTPRTRVDTSCEPVKVRLRKSSAARDITVSGPNLAGQAFKAGLVDVCHLLVAPIIVGRRQQRSPKRCQPPTDTPRRAALFQRHCLPTLPICVNPSHLPARWSRPG